MFKKFSIKKLIPSSAYEWMLFAIIAYYFSFNAGVLVIGKGALYYLITFSSALLLFFSCSKLIYRKRPKGMDSFMRVILISLIVWNITLIIRGLLSDISANGMARMLLYPREMLYYLSPVMALFVITPQRLSAAFKYWIFCVILAFIFTFVFRDVILVSSLSEINGLADDSGLSFYNYLNVASFIPGSVTGMAFFIICNMWRSNKERLFVYFMVVIGLLMVAMLGRRGGIATIVFYISLIFVLKIKYKPYLIFLFLVGLVFIYIAYMTYSNEIEDAFPILFDRLTDDTRTWAEDEFYKNFDGDWLSYLIGRGSKGMYYSPTYGMRGVIETGYLDLILHGGIISLSLTLLAYLYGFYMGFFHSHNRLVNAMALYLFANILFMYPGTPIDLSLGTYGVWLCVACCSNKQIRGDRSFSIVQTSKN